MAKNIRLTALGTNFPGLCFVLLHVGEAAKVLSVHQLQRSHYKNGVSVCCSRIIWSYALVDSWTQNLLPIQYSVYVCVKPSFVAHICNPIKSYSMFKSSFTR
uniref:Putative secreted protein n=1 Tax=Anopheles darlingi TaxID=43151 RepID=A0A2M4D2M2_ANODA